MRHIIDLSSLSQEEFDGLYRLASDIIDHPADFADACAGKVLGSLFYEPSTRTNLSFSTAMMRLGGNVVGFSDPSSSSAAKGESLKDTISMVSSYADMIVMRNPWEGAPGGGALLLRPGDQRRGWRSPAPDPDADRYDYHPAPARQRGHHVRGHLRRFEIWADGALAHQVPGPVSECAVLSHRTPGAGGTILHPAVHDRSSHEFYEVSGLDPVIPMLDVLYMTRIQRERFPTVEEYNSLKGIYCLNQSKLWHAKRDLLIMHPLPRVDEIAQDVDDDPRAVYFEQAKIGMYARMALLLTLSRQPSVRPRRPRAGQPGIRCTNPKCITNAETYLPMYQVASGDELCCIYCDKPTERVEKD